MGRGSYDSGQRPLSDVQYQPADDRYGQFSAPPQKKPLSNWIKIGVPVLILVIVGAVVGGVLGSRAAQNNNKLSTSGGGGGGNGNTGPAQGTGTGVEIGVFAASTDANMWPVYASATNTAAFTTPTFAANAAAAWPADPQQFGQPSLTQVRSDRPRMLAPKYKWDALPNLIKVDPYLKFWHESILSIAKGYSAKPVVPYDIDGGLSASGVLDPSREVKERIKAFAYAYRMTGDTAWVDRTWLELQNAAGNGTSSFGATGNNWNTAHFLDTAEFTAAFAIAYDWMYDIWTPDQRNAIMWSIINLGLNYGLAAHNGDASATSFSWWKTVNGNWNCVSNGGMILGSLAILNDDPTGVASALLPLAAANAAANCANGPSTDGTWSETANYWYFGTTGYAELTSALLTATGSDYGMLNNNAAFKLTGLYHIYVSGMTAMFNYGDHGPNKFSTTANAMLFMGSAFNNPIYTLWQRDRADSPEPWSMFWYDPSAKGAWWDGLELDHYFNDPSDAWASMRSTWTDNNGLFCAMKVGGLQKHQTHGDLDAGDFVIDALGTRWAGELGSANYIADGYFSNEDQNSVRWLWYRKMTEGQNTIAVNGGNQLVTYAPAGLRYESTGDKQESSTVYTAPDNSAVYFVADLSSAYGAGTSFVRGIRMLNARRQILIQDEITATAQIQWRMHTNATIAVDTSGTSATLKIEDKTLIVQLLNAPTGAKFERLDPVRTANAPQLNPGQEADQENPGVSVLAITLPAGTYSLQVLFNPQWPNYSSFKTPPAVTLANWSLTSH